MKKIFLFLLILTVVTPATLAQKVTSDSRVIKIEREQKVKKERNIKNYWLIKVGGGINYNEYYNDHNAKTYNVALGYITSYSIIMDCISEANLEQIKIHGLITINIMKANTAYI